MFRHYETEFTAEDLAEMPLPGTFTMGESDIEEGGEDIQGGFDALSNREEAFAGFTAKPLSSAAMADPVIMSLNPKLRMQVEPRAPESYTIFETIARKTGFLDLLPEVALPAIAENQKTYARQIEKTRTFISYENQIEGFRRLMILGQDVLGGYGPTLIGITDEGFVQAGCVKQTDRSSERQVTTIGETLELMRHGIDGWEIKSTPPNFDLNRHTRLSRRQAKEANFHVDIFGGLARPPRKLTRDMQKSMDDFKRIAMKTIASHQIKKINLIRWVITQSMDPDMLRLMRGTAKTHMRNAIWLSGTENSAPGRPITDAEKLHSRVRQQAVRSYPILSTMLLTGGHFQEVIDTMKPLAAALAEHLNTDVDRIKRLQGLTWQKAAVSPKAPEKRIKDILNIPNAYLPTSRNDYITLERIRSFSQTLFDEEFEQTFSRLSQGGSPYRFAERMRDSSAHDVMDAVRYLADTLYVPAMLLKAREFCENADMKLQSVSHHRLQSRAMGRIINDLKMADLFDLSDRYHRNIQRYEDRITKLEDRSHWAPCVGEFDLPGGLSARELHGTEQLKLQGRREDHCVGGYTNSVTSGKVGHANLIFSIEKEDRILSTLEVTLRLKTRVSEDPELDGEEYLKAEIRQNRGRGNADPEEIAETASAEIARHLEALDIESFKSYAAGLSEHREQVKAAKEMPDFIRSAGFNPFRQDHMEDAWRELSSALPRSIRKMGLDGFIESQDIRNIGMAFMMDDDAQSIWDHDPFTKLSAEKQEEREIRECNEPQRFLDWA